MFNHHESTLSTFCTPLFLHPGNMNGLTTPSSSSCSIFFSFGSVNPWKLPLSEQVAFTGVKGVVKGVCSGPISENVGVASPPDSVSPNALDIGDTSGVDAFAAAFASAHSPFSKLTSASPEVSLREKDSSSCPGRSSVTSALASRTRHLARRSSISYTDSRSRCLNAG